MRVIGSKQRDGLAIAMQRSDVDVRGAGADGAGASAARDPAVHQRADVVLARARFEPELAQIGEDRSANFECAPDPVRTRGRRLHLDLDDVVLLIEDDSVEELRTLDREAEKREVVVAEGAES